MGISALILMKLITEIDIALIIPNAHISIFLLTEICQSQPLFLLSCSLDRTIVVWTPDEESGVWLEHMRVGEMGGNTLGYYGARFGPLGNSILGHSYLGGFHMWKKEQVV